MAWVWTKGPRPGAANTSSTLCWPFKSPEIWGEKILYYLYYVMFPDSTRQFKWIITVLSSKRHLKIGLEKQKEANIGKF